MRRGQLQLGCPALAERVAERAAQHLVDERLFEKAHFRLGRVDVDVDTIRRNPDEQVHLRTALLDGRDAVGLGDGVRDRPVLDDAAVDEDVLSPADRPLIAERGDVALDLEPRGLLADLDQIEPLAEQLKEALGRPRRRRALQQPPRRRRGAAQQRETDFRIAKRHLGHQTGNLRRLGGVGLQELLAGRQVVEEVGDVDAGAFGRPDFAFGDDRAALHADLGACRAPPRPRPEREARDRGDARQRLTAEAEGANRPEVFGPGNLAGRMTLERQPRVLRLHPLAVVLDAQQPLAAKLHRHDDPRRPGVDGVLEQFLDDRRRPLDDFAGRYLIGEVEREAVDTGHRVSCSSNVFRNRSLAIRGGVPAPRAFADT